jgi:hypothetical protein
MAKISAKDLEFKRNKEGVMLDADGLVVFCDAECCENVAAYRVIVSVNKFGDATRNYCYTCQEVYMIGVQHGRFREAALYGAKPGRQSAMEAALEKTKNTGR